MYKIGIMGTHGVGKTTFAYQLLARKKKENPNLKVGIVTEVARDCPFPINKETTAPTQFWIFAEQLKREIEAEKRNDIVICDRTLLDNLAYTVCAGYKPFGLLAFVIDDWMHMYDELYFFRLKNKQPVASDGVRDTDVHFQRKIDKILALWVEVFKIKVKEM